MGLFDFLTGKKGVERDGTSPEKAIVVNSIPEEYAWMKQNCPGYSQSIQALQQINGTYYDVHTLNNSQGEQRTLYFDISKFFGR